MLLSILALLTARVVLAEGPERGFLVAKKALVGEYAVQGKNATVSIELYNAGDSPAYDVSLSDVEFPAEYFEVIDGDLSASFDRISAGGVAKHSYVVKARVSGPFILRPATVTYRASSEGDDYREVASTSSIMRIISPAESRTVQLLKVGRYLSLGSLQTVEQWRNALIAVVVSVLGASGFLTYNKITSKATQSKRRKAVADLGLEDD